MWVTWVTFSRSDSFSYLTYFLSLTDFVLRVLSVSEVCSSLLLSDTLRLHFLIDMTDSVTADESVERSIIKIS